MAEQFSVPAAYWTCRRKGQRLVAWLTGQTPLQAKAGDRIFNLCRVLGINKVTTWLEGKGINCGCKNRRMMLNQLGLWGWLKHVWSQSAVVAE